MADFFPPSRYWGIDEETAATLPLGLRQSNNLFNIKYYPGAERNQTKWPGLMGPSEARDQGDPQMKFANVEDSGVAAAGLMRRKYDSGMRSADQIIAGQNGWTPGHQQAPGNVARLAGVGPQDDLRLDTPEGMRRFLPALAEQEHGAWANKNLFRPEMFDRIAERATGAQFASGALPELAPLKDDGSNAHRWGSALQPQPQTSSPTTTASFPSPQPTARPRMDQDQQQRREPSFLEGLYGRTQNPMFQQGLGLFLAASQGGNLNEGLNAGMGRAKATQEYWANEQAAREKETAKQAYDKMFQNSGLFNGVPPALLEIVRISKDPSPVIQHILKTQTAGQTDDIKEYQYAVQGGFKGTFTDWMSRKKEQQGEYAKQLVYGTDAAGNVVPMQAGSKGTLTRSAMPEGVTMQRDPIKFDAGTHYVLMDPTTRQPIGMVPKNVAEVEQQKVAGEAKGKAMADLPAAESGGHNVLRYVDDVLGDKHLDNMIGWRGYTPNITPQSKALQAKIDQLGGQAFLTAFQSLKGAGAITDAEGKKATDALARFRTMVQNGEDYRKALTDFKSEVQRGMELARQKAGVAAPSLMPAQAKSPTQLTDDELMKLIEGRR